MNQELKNLYDKGDYYTLFYKILELQSSKKRKQKLNKDIIDILYFKLDSLVKLNFLNDAISEINDLLSNPNLTPISKLKLMIVEIKALIDQGKFIQALEIAYQGDFQLRSIQTSVKDDDEKFIGRYYNSVGAIHFYRGDLETSILFFKKALTILENYQEIKEISDTINNMGQVYQLLGEFDLANKCYLECISLYQSLSHERGIAISLNNLGVISLQQGNLDDAYNYFIESYGLIKKICNVTEQINRQFEINYKSLDYIMIHFENHEFLGELLSNLAETYARMGNISDSLENYTKAIYVYQKINNSVLISDLYIQLITLNLENDNYDSSRHYLELLTKLNASESKVIQIRIKYAKAMFYNKEQRFKGKYEAERIFYEIINAEKQIDWTLSVKAMTQLSELLFEEFSFFEDPKIIEEAKNIIDKMHALAKNKKSFSLLTETYLIKMKFAVIDENLETAMLYLDQAYFTSSEKNLGALINKVKIEREKLAENYQYWKDFLKTSSIKERFEKLEILDYMNEIKNVIIPFKD